jgi:hypothetical protein
VKAVDAARPKMRAQARPEKMGSRVMGQAPRAVVTAVSRMGRMRAAPLCSTASRRGRPSLRLSWMNSMSTRELRITMPPRAIMPIMAVAVKNTGSGYLPTGLVNSRLSSQNPGMIPMRVSGMALMTRSGLVQDLSGSTSRM